MCEEFENEKKKEQKNFDLPEQGFEPQIFSNFSAHDLKLLKEIGLSINSLLKWTGKREGSHARPLFVIQFF